MTTNPIQTPDPRLVALLAAAAQLARVAEPCLQCSDEHPSAPAYVVPAADVRRLRRALKNLSR